VDYRLVRWVGDPPVWSDPTIGKGLATQSLSLATADKRRFFNKWQRQFPVPGHSTRIIGPESGYSQTYQFGPHQFLVWMTTEDAAHLFRNRWERWQFLDVTETPFLTERPRMSKEQWLALLDDFALLGPGRMAGTRLSVEQAARDAAQRQRLGEPRWLSDRVAGELPARKTA
jgi:hypothetical protein